MLSHKALAKAQEDCQDVKHHRENKGPKSSRMSDLEFYPGVSLYCDTSKRCKANPLVPKEWREMVIKLFHQIDHAGQKETVHKVSNRYYWPTLRN